MKARKKLVNETEQQELSRRLEEYIEYALATKRFADVGFYEKLLKYIDKEVQKRGYFDENLLRWVKRGTV